MGKMSEGLCSVCQSKPPMFVCFCVEAPVCQSCISRHLLDHPTLPHKPIPVNSRELILFLRSEAKLSPKRGTSKEEYRTVLQREVERVESVRQRALLDLDLLHSQLTSQVDATIREMKSALFAKAERLSVVLKQKLAALDDPALPPAEEPLQQSADETVLANTHIKEIDLTHDIKAAFQATFALQANASSTVHSTMIHKPCGGSNFVGLFDCKAEKLDRMMTASVRFFHNSCTCIGPRGVLYITGGSLTGRSRNEAYSFCPRTGVTAELQSMAFARRSHAAIHCGGKVLVFGGLLDEERLSLCEAYAGETEGWTQLAQMKERRAYLACCEFQESIFIGGGAVTSSCEKYMPSSNTFLLLPVTQQLIEDNCSMVSLPSGILLFHGSFCGKVLHFDPASGVVSRKPDMCVGNSWSSSALVLIGSTVYMLRAESVFKYEVETGESSYVARISKTTRRKVGLDEA